MRWMLTVALLLSIVAVAVPIQAQSDVRTFPETGHSLRGAFRVFWESNGGLPIFGYPISEEVVGSNGRLVQWFERARFELAEGGANPRVELAHLGREFTGGRVFPQVPPIPDSADRRYIAETQHIIKFGFKEVWETRGAEQIFGYPISEEVQEVLENGRWHTVQYFEKARFEYWPEFAPGERVLISQLGRALRPAELPAPVTEPVGQPVATAPADAPTATPIPPSPTPAPIPSPTPAPAPVLPAPTFNNCQADPNPSAAPNFPVRITDINKSAETVTLQNISTQTIDLTGWRMCSITGNQQHPIGGTLAPGVSRTFSGPSGSIWNNSERDDGALYDDQGRLVSYWRD